MKKISLFLITVLFIFTLCACTEKTISVKIAYEDDQGNAGGMQSQMNEGSLKDLLDDFSKSSDFSYELDDEGRLISVNGILSDENGTWQIYRNDQLLEIDPAEVSLEDNDYFVIRYKANNE